MTQKHFIDRSRIESFQRCNRKRWHEYHDGRQQHGITPARISLALCVGGSVHAGLAELLREAVMLEKYGKIPDERSEEQAVAVALADFSQHTSAGLQVDASEAHAMGQGQDDNSYGEMLRRQALALGMTEAEANDFVITNAGGRERAASEFDRYLVAEQTALVEAMVRAYARRRLRPLLEEFEVLEVEREGTWILKEWWDCGRCKAEQWATAGICGVCGHSNLGADAESRHHQLWFMSRPDALLRHRIDSHLEILSYKTTGAWDIRKDADAKRDMQGLSEGVEVERRLGDWWSCLKHEQDPDTLGRITNEYGPPSDQMIAFLRSCSAPPRIDAIRYEYLLKGERWKDKELSAQLGMDVRSQRSALIRQYVATSIPKKGTASYSVGDVCWSWDYIKEDGTSGSLAWQNWQSHPVFNEGGGDAYAEANTSPNVTGASSRVKSWIDKLDASHETMSAYDSTTGLPPRSLGYASEAQRLGTTTQHPLDAVFIPPITVMRNDDELRDLFEQVEAQERRIAEAVSLIHAVSDNAKAHNDAVDEGEKRSLLNRHFPQTRRACEYPGTCEFAKLCWGASELRADPEGSGMYKQRVANHPQENET